MVQNPRADAEALVQRSEQLLERAVGRSVMFLARTFARAREEAEDIWAEAKSLNSSGRS
jgi:hypothetical protein